MDAVASVYEHIKKIEHSFAIIRSQKTFNILKHKSLWARTCNDLGKDTH